MRSCQYEEYLVGGYLHDLTAFLAASYGCPGNIMAVHPILQALTCSNTPGIICLCSRPWTSVYVANFKCLVGVVGTWY